MTKSNKKPVHPLRIWRISQGLTQIELAKKLNYQTPSIIHGIESWNLEPKIGEVLRLCQMSDGSLHPLIPSDFARN